MDILTCRRAISPRPFPLCFCRVQCCVNAIHSGPPSARRQGKPFTIGLADNLVFGPRVYQCRKARFGVRMWCSQVTRRSSSELASRAPQRTTDFGRPVGRHRDGLRNHAIHSRDREGGGNISCEGAQTRQRQTGFHCTCKSQFCESDREPQRPDHHGSLR